MADDYPSVREADGAITVLVRVKPRSAVEGPLLKDFESAEHLQWSIHAAPIDGKANSSLLKSISGHLSIPLSSLELLRGAASRIKLIRVGGITKAEFIRRMNP